MNTLVQKKEDTLLTSDSSINKNNNENESARKQIKRTTKKVKTPLMRYLNLIDDASPSYVLGYN
jgi:hypothetical protein